MKKQTRHEDRGRETHWGGSPQHDSKGRRRRAGRTKKEWRKVYRDGLCKSQASSKGKGRQERKCQVVEQTTVEKNPKPGREKRVGKKGGGGIKRNCWCRKTQIGLRCVSIQKAAK